MAKKQKTKQKSVIKYLKETQVSLMTGSIALFAQSILILNVIPSMEMEGQVSVLQANIHALLSMAGA